MCLISIDLNHHSCINLGHHNKTHSPNFDPLYSVDKELTNAYSSFVVHKQDVLYNI